MYARGEHGHVRANHHFCNTPPHFVRSPGDAAKCIFLAEMRGLLCALATMLPEGQCKGLMGPVSTSW